MDLNTKQIKIQIKKLTNVAKNYVIYFFAGLIILVNGFLILQINSLIAKEPSQEQITTHENTIKRLKIDESSVSKIQQLRDQNIAVQGLFKEARNNPFVD